MDFSGYTGWQIYSGSNVYDIRIGIDPEPPTEGWLNNTEFLFGWNSGAINQPLSGETFLRGTSISWLDGVRVNKGMYLDHGLNSDLYQGNQALNNGLTGFFVSSEDFWE